MSLGIEFVTIVGADNDSSSDLSVTVTLVEVLTRLRFDLGDDVLEYHSVI